MPIVAGPWSNRSLAINQASDSGSATKQLNVSLSATNYLAQIAGGAAIDSAGPFTLFSPTRVVQIVLGVGGANPTIYTVTGTSIYDDSIITDVITAAGAATYVGTKGFATVTRLESDVDPVGTTDLQAVDTWVYPASRVLHVGVAGDINCRLMEDGADVINTEVPVGDWKRRVSIVRIASTAATNLTLAW